MDLGRGAVVARRTGTAVSRTFSLTARVAPLRETTNPHGGMRFLACRPCVVRLTDGVLLRWT